MSFRAAFELKFPVPVGVTWNARSRQYDRLLRSKCTAARHEAYANCWSAWKGGMEHLADAAQARKQAAAAGAQA